VFLIYTDLGLIRPILFQRTESCISHIWTFDYEKAAY